MSQDIYWLYWITLTCAITLSHTSLRALRDRRDLVNNPSWADYRLCLTAKHFHVIPWPFRPKILTLLNMRAFMQTTGAFIFRNRSLDVHCSRTCSIYPLKHWKKSLKQSTPLQRALFWYFSALHRSFPAAAVMIILKATVKKKTITTRETSFWCYSGNVPSVHSLNCRWGSSPP